MVGCSPVCGCLPGSIEHAVEHIKEHGADVATFTPVDTPVLVLDIGIDFSSSVGFLEGVAATPDGHGKEEQSSHADLSTHAAGEARAVESEAEDISANDLRGPVQDIVERACADVEPGGVDVLEVVGVEPVRGQEEWEEEDDVPI